MIDTRHHLDFHAIGLSYFTQSESMNYTKIWKPENILILVIDSWLPGKKKIQPRKWFTDSSAKV